MVNYYNSTRTIQVGDRVIGHGNCCGRNLTDLRGTVICLYGDERSFDAGIQWEGISWGHTLGGRLATNTGFMVCGRHLIYAGESVDIPADDRPRCEYCGRPMDKTALGSRLFKNTLICDDCIKRELGEVHSYHYAKGLTYNVDANKITFGWECEIDAPSDWDCDFDTSSRGDLARDCIDYARDNKYALIHSYESDGSLNDGGVECVSAPLTINDIKRDDVKLQIDFLLRRAEELGFNFDDDNHAGFHVHIGRKSLCGGDFEISNAVGLLMGWAVTRLWDKGFKELSRRTNLEYTHLYNYAGDGVGLNCTPANYDRYYVVNVQNSKTIELRVFNNARTYDDVCVAVDMCYMLAKWATKKINAFLKRNTYSAKSKDFTDALAYADRLTWDALVKYSKFPEYTLPAMRRAGINV